MDLTSKQRSQLRGLANGIDTIVHIGKDGIGDNLTRQANVPVAGFWPPRFAVTRHSYGRDFRCRSPDAPG